MTGHRICDMSGACDMVEVVGSLRQAGMQSLVGNGHGQCCGNARDGFRGSGPVCVGQTTDEVHWMTHQQLAACGDPVGNARTCRNMWGAMHACYTHQAQQESWIQACKTAGTHCDRLFLQPRALVASSSSKQSCRALQPSPTRNCPHCTDLKHTYQDYPMPSNGSDCAQRQTQMAFVRCGCGACILAAVLQIGKNDDVMMMMMNCGGSPQKSGQWWSASGGPHPRARWQSSALICA